MRHFIIALALGIFAFCSPAKAEGLYNADVQQAEAYLQGLKTATADFIQTSTLGARLSGKFYLNRPGKLRFDYNEVEDFIVADGVFVYFYDSQLESQSNAPIGTTLADFLLRSNLSLKGDLSVTQTFKRNGHVSITMVQTDDESAGQVELIFSEVPYQLARWRVTDPQGETTEVVLKNLETGMTFKDKNLFGYHDPKGRKKFND